MDDVEDATFELIVRPESDIQAPGSEKYDQVEKDFEEIQDNLMKLADKVVIAIDTLAQLADGSQHPLAYQALAKLIDSAAKINKEAADVIKRKQDLYDGLGKKSTMINNGTVNQTYVDNRSPTAPQTTTDVIEQLRREQQERG